MRENMRRRVVTWIQKGITAAASEPTREEITAHLAEHGWVVKARVVRVPVSKRYGYYGWLFRHPEHGILLFADKTRPEDQPEGAPAARGMWGGHSRWVWGSDVTDLFLDGQITENSFPAHRPILALAVHLLRETSPEEQATIATVLTLAGVDLDRLTRTHDRDPLEVTRIR